MDTKPFSLVPSGIIDDSRVSHPFASIRVAVFVAVGGLVVDHPWKPHATRVTVRLSRLIEYDLNKNQSSFGISVTVPIVLLMLQQIGVLTEVELKKDGFVVYQNQKWLEYHLARAPEDQFQLMHYEAEQAQWTVTQPNDEGSE